MISRAERLKLYADNHALVRCVVKRAFPRSDPDMLVIGELALWNATETWKPDQASFCTWACWRIRYKVMQYLRDCSRTVRIPAWKLEADREAQVQVLSYDEHPRICEGIGVDGPGTQSVEQEWLRGQVPERYRCGVEYLQRVCEGESVRDVARSAGVHDHRVHARIRMALKHLRLNPAVAEWAGVESGPLTTHSSQSARGTGHPGQLTQGGHSHL